MANKEFYEKELNKAKLNLQVVMPGIQGRLKDISTYNYAINYLEDYEHLVESLQAYTSIIEDSLRDIKYYKDRLKEAEENKDE